MNVYEIEIWRGVRRSGEFSHNARRSELVHALNEERARKKITLAEGKVMGQEPNLVEMSAETIYSVTKTGTVTKQMFYVYSDGRNPRQV